jgi:hypothetical protein
MSETDRTYHMQRHQETKPTVSPRCNERKDQPIDPSRCGVEIAARRITAGIAGNMVKGKLCWSY